MDSTVTGVQHVGHDSEVNILSVHGDAVGTKELRQQRVGIAADVTAVVEHDAVEHIHLPLGERFDHKLLVSGEVHESTAATATEVATHGLSTQ